MNEIYKINGNPAGFEDLDVFHKLAQQFLPFAHKKLGFDKPVGVNLLSDPENMKDPLGKTAYYDPNKMEITLFVDKRHVKDILRSLSHELVHHKQNCRGEFDRGLNTEPGYAQNDEHMRKCEAEAYLHGSGFLFRDWEDSLKKENQVMLEEKDHKGSCKKVHKGFTHKEWLVEELNLMEVWPAVGLSVASALAGAATAERVLPRSRDRKWDSARYGEERRDAGGGRFDREDDFLARDLVPGLDKEIVLPNGETIEVPTIPGESQENFRARVKQMMSDAMSKGAPGAERIRSARTHHSYKTVAEPLKEGQEENFLFRDWEDSLKKENQVMSKSKNLKEQEESIFAPNHYCIHHGAVYMDGAIQEGKVIFHNWNDKLQKVTKYDMQLADGTIVEGVDATDILVTNASLAEEHSHSVGKKDDDEESTDTGQIEIDDEVVEEDHGDKKEKWVIDGKTVVCDGGCTEKEARRRVKKSKRKKNEDQSLKEESSEDRSMTAQQAGEEERMGQSKASAEDLKGKKKKKKKKVPRDATLADVGDVGLGKKPMRDVPKMDPGGKGAKAKAAVAARAKAKAAKDKKDAEVRAAGMYGSTAGPGEKRPEEEKQVAGTEETNENWTRGNKSELLFERLMKKWAK